MPNISAFLDSYCSHLQSTLGDQVAGIYLYGSAATGDFISGKSDIDLIVLCQAALPATDVGRLHDLVVASALPFWLAGIDCAILTAAHAGSPQQEVQWEVVLQCGHTRGKPCPAGARLPVDCSL